MQRQPPAVRQRLEKFAEQVGVHAADFQPRRDDMVGERRPAGQVNDDPCQGFVQRRVGAAETTDAGFVAQCGGQGGRPR